MERRNNRNSTGGWDKPYHSFLGKHFEEPSEEYGLDGDRISKLNLKLYGEWIANYDRGWDTESTCKEAQRFASAFYLMLTTK